MNTIEFQIKKRSEQITQKICRVCDKKKKVSAFYKRDNKKDGYANDCKACCAKRQKENYIKRKIKEMNSVTGDQRKALDLETTSTYEFIISLIEKYDLKNVSKAHRYSYPRFYLYNFLREFDTKLFTMKYLAELTNKDDHTAVLYGINQHKAMIDTDATYQRYIVHIRKDLQHCPAIKMNYGQKIDPPIEKQPINELINRINELPYSPESEALKAFVNKNINPEKIKQ